MQAAQADISERDRLGVNAYDGTGPHLRTRRHHRIKICKDRVVEGNEIVGSGIRASHEFGDGIVPEARQEDERVVAACPSEFVVASQARDDVVAGSYPSGFVELRAGEFLEAAEGVVAGGDGFCAFVLERSTVTPTPLAPDAAWA